VSGAGVYWMYYSGASFEAAPAPAGLAGLAAGTDVEGLRSASLTHLPGCIMGLPTQKKGHARCTAGHKWEGKVAGHPGGQG
jgi:hypothetical protein